MLKCFLSCLEIQFLFHYFLKFACHVHHLLEALPTHRTFLCVKITWFIPVQQWGAAGQGGPSLPVPHSSASLAPLALVTPECWALRLCGWEQQKKKDCGVFLAINYYKGSWSQCMRGIQAHIQENTHWACTQACILKYSYSGSGPSRGKGTESLVLGAQLLVIWGWAMSLGSGERWL